ncbi:uncharacterized protein LOC121802321 isoform X3 [Salvia splendens]|uniref:uncharacterized protein LOC121802321 isoform X3 n=1 Tax=Salvia splendens TaxID=180675 RepID=UPI001C25AD08|nr:uncharacterized protein LOC121802321 isoform X3 [Salvia splendens]XP_042057899.1 uncharacterized protein LOC121802321 isoform X3 [Salvia splendens]
MLPEPDSSSQYSSLHLHKFRNDTFDRLPVEKKCLIREFEGNVLVERCECSVIQVSVYCMQRVLGDVSMFVVGKDEYDELALS